MAKHHYWPFLRLPRCDVTWKNRQWSGNGIGEDGGACDGGGVLPFPPSRTEDTSSTPSPPYGLWGGSALGRWGLDIRTRDEGGARDGGEGKAPTSQGEA